MVYVVRLLVLGNGAAGAEKQALALGARLREKLLEKSVSYRSNVSCSPVECVRVTLGRSHIIPPVLQVFGAKVSRNPLFGYREQDTSRLFPAQKDARALDVEHSGALCRDEHPRVPLTWFDAVVVPRHDFPRGEGGVDNLFLTTGTVHDITPELLQQHEREWREEFDEKLQGRQTRVVWLLGGPCRGFSFTDQDAERMVDEFLLALPDNADVAVLVTFSRRTPQNVQRIVRRGLAAKFLLPGQLLVWKGTESRNPYYALLSTASCVVTTPDSISMTTEAIASGKPVFTIGVENCKGKFLRFHQSLFASKTTAPLTADAIETALLRKHDVSSYASAALEKEIASIVDDIATDIRGVLKQLESE
ncbi:Mitochondrial fission protein ELM1-like isoform X1 [Phytophthora palmivora]|uniref:Mitochondrial fission protein ELM1-like isoform X1 n=1 Tax=Phytophthora palmivora TaxID=4796 RepID=A0A2P4XRB2_9STRA|nr:Mitochondrial fission protein ELM1-like isoform X1 [Phytophthora palmivora]